MRVLAGSPARENESDTFLLHVEGLNAQNSDDVTIFVHHELTPDPGGPRWTSDKIGTVARARQRTLNEAKHGYDALFMVDTDVICGPGTLEAMMKVDADVVYGVFWSRWDGFGELMPQVWDTHHYGHTPEMTRVIAQMRNGAKGEMEVFGGGACTLIRAQGFKSRYHPRLQSLVNIGTGMWPGEDRSYCIGLEARGIKQIAVFGPKIMHLDTPDLQTPEMLARARNMVGL